MNKPVFILIFILECPFSLTYVNLTKIACVTVVIRQSVSATSNFCKVIYIFITYKNVFKRSTAF